MVLITDYFSNASNGTTPLPTTLASQKVFGAGSCSLNLATGWDTTTPVHFLMYQVDANNALVPNTETVWKGVLTGTTVNSLTLKSGTDLNYPAGSVVELAPTSAWANDLIKGIQQSVNPNGTLITAAVQTALGITAAPAAGWTTLGYAPNTITANGNHSFNAVWNARDLTGVLSPGMRMQMPRTATAPIKSTSLNGSTQYYSKSAPTGMTFTNNFVVSAWIKLSAYSATDQVIASRYDGTSGWRFSVDQTSVGNSITLWGYNAGVGDYSIVRSYQAVPLNKWVHVAAQLDMATFTATPTTSYVMFDGVDVPASVIRAGSNPTALIQSGNLEIGSTNGGTLPFGGTIAQVAIYSAKVTEATILTSMNQALVGNETSEVSAYSFNNSLVDLNANANNLTANGGAVATNADSPFANGVAGSTEYGIVQSVSFSTNTTAVIQTCEGCVLPTSGGMGISNYSPDKSPYAFPGQKTKWTLEALTMDNTIVLGTTSNTWYSSNVVLSVPVGSWTLGYDAGLYSDGGSASRDHYATLSTSSSALTIHEFDTHVLADNTTNFMSSHAKSREYNVPTQIPYYLLARIVSGSISNILVGPDYACSVTARNAYL